MKKVIVLLLMAAFVTAAFGQGKRKDKIRAAKIEYIKKKLALSADEEKKFLPIYTSFLDENDALRKSLKKDINLEEVDLTFMSDEECEKLINEISAHKQKEVDLIKKYTTEFKKILPIKKVAMVFKAEHDFRKHLVKELRLRSKKMREETRKIREESRKIREKSKTMREESRKMREKFRQMSEEHREKLEEARKTLNDSKLSDEDRKKIKEDIERVKKELKEQRKQLKKEFKELKD